MPEIGLVNLATIALHTGQTPLRAYCSNFSKHRFQQPKLLAIVCLTREAE